MLAVKESTSQDIATLMLEVSNELYEWDVEHAL